MKATSAEGGPYRQRDVGGGGDWVVELRFATLGYNCRHEGYTTNRDMAELASSKARDAAERCRIEIL